MNRFILWTGLFSCLNFCYCQTDVNALGITFHINSFPQLDIVYDQPLLARSSAIFTKSLFGIEANAFYATNISEQVLVRGGIIMGVQPYGLTLYSTNFDANDPDKFIFDDISGYDMSYFGFHVDGELKIPFKKNEYKSRLGIYGGLLAVYHIPWSISLGYHNSLGNGTVVTLFDVNDILVNEDNNFTFGVRLGVDYVRKISRRIEARVGVNLMYSDKVVMETSKPYNVYSLDMVRSGSFSQRFMSAGFSIGMNYLLLK
ncbi:MAG: hypothetical protein R2795_26990 [Saprospiraceae bacterium]